MAENPDFIKLLEKMKLIHEKKNQDYSSEGFYENFTREAEIISWFKSDIDKVFSAFIGVKLARLATLLSSDKTPNFESIEDTFLDLTTYAAIWASYYAANNIKPKPKCIHDWSGDIIPICYKCNLKWSTYLVNPQ